MLIKWKTLKWNENKIERVECVRETDKQVVILEYPWGNNKKQPQERRHLKESGYEQFHDSWEEAHAYLMKQAEEKLLSARRSLQRAQDELGNVKGMRKPPETKPDPDSAAQGD